MSSQQFTEDGMEKVRKDLNKFLDGTVRYDGNHAACIRDIIEHLNQLLTRAIQPFNFIIHDLKYEYKVQLKGQVAYESFHIGQIRYGIWIFESGIFEYSGRNLESIETRKYVGGFKRGNVLEASAGRVKFSKPLM